MDILRIATAGSVDDGKSTLIGRLLYETNSITKDKIEALESASKRKGLDFLDLSLLTDGLIAEREQGITIDVAHIYFATPRRKYIIADTPGHFEYTRNMVTGASNASVSLILIDARHGVVEQTHRHFYISSMLRIPNVIVCINKMDLVNYEESRFDEIVNSFQETASKGSFLGQNVQFIPISSLFGDNLIKHSEKMNWFKGESLLETLENIEVGKVHASHFPARFPVQFVIRPMTDQFHDYRGYSGKISSGKLMLGDDIMVLPTGQKSKIKSIEKFGNQLNSAIAKESVIITLENDVDISRGNMLVKINEPAESIKEISARICWLDHQNLVSGKMYLLQHGINRVKAKVIRLDEKINVETLQKSGEASELKLNEIGWIKLKAAQPIFADKFVDNPENGCFILIDESSNNTVGIGFIE